MFRRYAGGESITDIVEDLNARGIRTSKGNRFNKNSLARIFANRRYIGEYAYKEIVVPNAIPPIVSKDIFERVAIRMKQNKHATGKAKAPERYLLTTKLFCGTCQSMFVGDSANKPNGTIYRYYKCASAKRHECERKAIRKDWIEDKVIEEISAWLNNDKLVACSYDLESGLKLHYNKYFLSDLRQKSDEICQAHGLNVLKKYNPNVKSQRLGPKEYRAAMNGNSWKMALRVAIDFCMSRAGSKEEFQSLMKKYGYDMVWTPERKYITYICQTAEGKTYKVRDIKLNDEKYLKENMEYEFRIRAKLYGQAQGNEYAAGNTASDARRTAGGTDGTGDSDGTDQRRGMDAAERNDTQNGGSVSPAVSAESGGSERGEQVHREDDEGGRGAERGNGEGSAQGDDGSGRTGWESERESFRSYRQKNSSGRGTVVAPTRTHGSPNAAGIALMGARGIANVGSIIEDDSEKSEEEKREREARNAASVAGILVGGAVGAMIELSKPKPTPTDDVDDGEDQGMGMTM